MTAHRPIRLSTTPTKHLESSDVPAGMVADPRSFRLSVAEEMQNAIAIAGIERANWGRVLGATVNSRMPGSWLE